MEQLGPAAVEAHELQGVSGEFFRGDFAGVVGVHQPAAPQGRGDFRDGHAAAPFKLPQGDAEVEAQQHHADVDDRLAKGHQFQRHGGGGVNAEGTMMEEAGVDGEILMQRHRPLFVPQNGREDHVRQVAFGNGCHLRTCTFDIRADNQLRLWLQAGVFQIFDHAFDEFMLIQKIRIEAGGVKHEWTGGVESHAGT